MRGLRPRGGPFHVALRRAVGQDEPARSIGAIFGDDIDRIHHVLLRFRHLRRRDDLHRVSRRAKPGARFGPLDIFGKVIDRAVLLVPGHIDLVRHHPLREQCIEGLDRAFGQVATDMHRAGKEPRIEQVQDRVLDPADILVDIHPVGRVFGHRGRRGPGRGETREIPRRIDEGVHRVGFAFRGLATGWAGHVAPRGMTVERVAGLVEGHVIGQADRQVRLGFGHHAAGVAMDHRDRAAPVALPRQAPVAQAVLGDTGAPALGLSKGDGGVDGLLPRGHVETGEMVDPAHLFRLGRNKGHFIDRAGILQRHEGVDHRKPVFATEIKVALVMGRAAEDRAGAVVHQDEIGDPDRQFPVGVRAGAAPSGRCRSPASRPFSSPPPRCPCGGIRR